MNKHIQYCLSISLFPNKETDSTSLPTKIHVKTLIYPSDIQFNLFLSGAFDCREEKRKKKRLDKCLDESSTSAVSLNDKIS